MTDNNSKQFAAIMRRADQIDSQQKRLSKEIDSLRSIQAATTAELRMLTERIDIFFNQEWLQQQIKENTKNQLNANIIQKGAT